MREIYIERQSEILRIAIKNKDRLEECFIEEEDNSPSPGEIYKGIIKNIVPAIKCAFVDIGWRKNAYMYMDSRFKNLSIKKGDEVIVEVLKEELGDKGPKVTNAFTVAGRYSVLTTLDKDLSFSKKLQDIELLETLKKSLVKPSEVGIMIRTNAQNVEPSVINEEIDELYDSYKKIRSEAKYSFQPKLILSTGGVLDKVLRDNLDCSVSSIVVSDEKDFNYVRNYLKGMAEMSVKLKLHEDSRSLFGFYGIEKEIISLRNRRVTMPEGSYLVIDKTEAMHVIDVNSGKNVRSGSIDKTAYYTNLLAAVEVSRQIRLRNLSGIILIDFIDMDNEAHKSDVLHRLMEGFEGDKNKTVIYPFTELNLVQIARRRRGKTLDEFLEEGCSYCGGSGRRLRFSYIKSLIKNEIIRIEKEHDIKDIYIEMDEIYKKDVLGDIFTFAGEVEALDRVLYVNFLAHKELVKVEPVIFGSQIKNLQSFKIYG